MNELVKFRQIVRDLVDRREWEEIYLLSSIIRREVSILIDADDAIWIDVGDQSQVSLSPPYGSKLPFKLWVHTHPNMLAYWSATDQESLKMATNILDRAYVLGGDGLLFTQSNMAPDRECIPGLAWSQESVTPWHKFREVGL